MSEYSYKMVIVIILLLIAVVVSVIVFVKGVLISPYVPIPPDKERLIKYLTCSFVLCAHGCGTSEVTNIQLDGNLNCNDVFNCNTKPYKEHLCGPGYKLHFQFRNEVNYNSNITVHGVNPLGKACNSVQNDIMKSGKKEVWYDRHCNSDSLHNILLDNFEVDSGCIFFNDCTTNWVGTCYGTLRGSGSCSKGNTKSGFTTAWSVGTGHLWLDPALVTNCKEFSLDEKGTPSGTKYYGECKFKSGLNITIWTEPDTWTHNPCWPSDCSVTHYCPELIICVS